MKFIESQSLFPQQEVFDSSRLNNSGLNNNSLLSVVPYIPDRGYVGTHTDRKKFFEMSKIFLVRPAYLVGLVKRYPYHHTFYTLVVDCKSFQDVRERIRIDYRHKKYLPEIGFLAQLMPLVEDSNE